MEESASTIEARDFGRAMAEEMIAVIKTELEARNMDQDAITEFWQGIEDGFANV